MKGFFEEFKKFIARGNVMDMAVGMIIGAAFTSIVKSLVDDVFMPVLSLLTSGMNIAEMGITIKAADPAVAYEVLGQIAARRGCMGKGGEPDLDKAAAVLMDDFRSGRLGRVTLEAPEA